MPYVRIGGRATYRPPILTKVQTDGSYTRQLQRIAAVVTKPDQSLQKEMMTIHATSSTETEWASVAMGIHLAQHHSDGVIGLENDLLGIIHALMFAEKSIMQENERYYRNEIYRLAEASEWVGVRWIPREINRADDLFR